jgi:hypothetical protein
MLLPLSGEIISAEENTGESHGKANAKKIVRQTLQRSMPAITFIRLCLSGAIAGVAIMGVIAPHFGFDSSHLKEVFGSVVGIGVVAAFKLAHVI